MIIPRPSGNIPATAAWQSQASRPARDYTGSRRTAAHSQACAESHANPAVGPRAKHQQLLRNRPRHLPPGRLRRGHYRARLNPAWRCTAIARTVAGWAHLAPASAAAKSRRSGRRRALAARAGNHARHADWQPQPSVTTKDLTIQLIGQLSSDGATYMAVEFSGDGLSGLSPDARAVLTNMMAEMGAKNAAWRRIPSPGAGWKRASPVATAGRRRASRVIPRKRALSRRACGIRGRTSP